MSSGDPAERGSGVRLVLASRNAHKLREFTRLLQAYEIVPLEADVQLPPEDGLTYAENALVKARTAAAAAGRVAFADDSGIEAATLGGQPGVLSARFTGPEATDATNLARLVSEAPPGSGLTYVCVIALVVPGVSEELFEGRCEGWVASAPAGNGGFGYDPAFIPAAVDDGRTMAQLSDAEKDAVSHRGLAARALAARLRAGVQRDLSAG